MNKELTIRKEKYDLDQPVQMVGMANVLKGHIMKQNLFTSISGKNYAHVEGWQFAGGLMGIYPKVVSVENLSTGQEIKWRANVEVVRLKDDKVMGYGFAICSNKENKKKSFDEYAVLSMAQTRAIGKAYRNLIGWVMKMSGYEATPSEEMAKMGEMPSAGPAVPQNARSAAEMVANPGSFGVACKGTCGTIITSKPIIDYSTKLWKKPLCRDCQPKPPKGGRR